MGWWARLEQQFNDWNWGCEEKATHTMNKIRSTVRNEHGGDLEIVRPLEAEMLKRRLQGMAVEGYPHSVRTAEVLWQLCKERYPEWITDADRPIREP